MKGISPVVATILLIGITIVAVVGVWLLTQRSLPSSGVAKIDVVGVEAKASPDARRCSFSVVLRNSGNVPVTVKYVYVSVGSEGGYLEPRNVRIAPGSTMEFTGEGYSNNPVFTDGSTAKINITYTGPDGQDRTIIEYATIRTSRW